MEDRETLQEIADEADKAIHRYKTKIHAAVVKFIMNKISKDEMISEIDFYKKYIDMERSSYESVIELLDED